MVTEFLSSVALSALLTFGGDVDSGSETVLATHDGFTLTQADFDQALEIDRALIEDYSEEDRRALRENLIVEFRNDPEELLAAIEESYAEIILGDGADTGAPDAVPVSSRDGMGAGHRQMREIMSAFLQGAELAPDAYTAPEVNQLRQYMANSQIISSNFNDYSSSKRVFTFCPDGRFFYYFGSVTDIQTKQGVGLGASKRDLAEGVWETYHEGGQVAVLMYSNVPAFAIESLNNTGLLPVPIAKTQSDLIQIGARGSRATPDMLMRRIPNVGC